jgi:predicted TIM-barrel fold metal-dependent hydrolase
VAKGAGVETLAIDYLCGHFTEENIRRNFFESSESEVFEAAGRLAGLRGYTAEDFLAHLEKLGIGRVVIPTLLTWDYWNQQPIEQTFVEEVAEAHAAFPDRIFGLYGVNPRKRMDGVREMEDAIRHKGFLGLHIHPHGFGVPPSHPWYYPYYAKCEELGAVVAVSMGHTLDSMPNQMGRPMHLDEVALYFPRLTIICGHTGWPWVDEAIALASKHPNVYIGTSGYAPKYWQPQMVRFMDSRRGRGKVVWGTDYPLVRHEESIGQIHELDIKDETRRALLNENARRVFKLP